MRNLLTVGVAVGLVLLGAASASADTILLSLTDMPGSGTAVFPPFTGDSPGSGGTVYDLSFVATASTTTLSVAGYQEIGWWDAQSNSVTVGGGSNLLGAVWTFVPASSGSLTTTYSDGTPVPALAFAAISGLFDTYSQTFATTIGDTYTYSFEFLNTPSPNNAPSGLLITTSGGSAGVIPEPSTWAMMLVGFVGLGVAGYRATRKAQTSSTV